jgi:hypothetical protein
MNWQEQAEQLKRIPHLLLLSTNVDKILNEVNHHIDDYPLININLEIRNQSGKIRPWYGRGLIDYRPSSRELYEYLALKKEWISFDENGDVNLVETDLAAKMPQTMSFVRSIVAKPRITRILRIPPGAILPWHSHCQSKIVGLQPYRKMVVQIPLVTSEKVIYRVKPLDSDENNSFDLAYKAGHVRVFNSWHEHQVENNSTNDRLSLYIEAPLTDAIFSKHINEALINYHGPKI